MLGLHSGGRLASGSSMGFEAATASIYIHALTPLTLRTCYPPSILRIIIPPHLIIILAFDKIQKTAAQRASNNQYKSGPEGCMTSHKV